MILLQKIHLKKVSVSGGGEFAGRAAKISVVMPKDLQTHFGLNWDL